MENLLFWLIVLIIASAIISPLLKEIDKRNAENRLAKKIAEEMKKGNESLNSNKK